MDQVKPTDALVQTLDLINHCNNAAHPWKP
jgi:hypothetical protein